MRVHRHDDVTLPTTLGVICDRRHVEGSVGRLIPWSILMSAVSELRTGDETVTKNHSLDAWLFTWRIVARCKFITTNAKLSVQIELTFYIFAKISSTKSYEINLTANLLTLNSSGTEFLITALKKQLSKIRHSSSNTTHLA